MPDITVSGRAVGLLAGFMIGTCAGALPAQTRHVVVRGAVEPAGVSPMVRMILSDRDTIPCLPDRALPDAICHAKVGPSVDRFRVEVWAPGHDTRRRNFSRLPVVNDTMTVSLPPMTLKELGLVQPLSTLVVGAPPVVTLSLRSGRKETVHVRQVSLAAYETVEALPSDSCPETLMFDFEPSLTIDTRVPPDAHAPTDTILRENERVLGAEGHALRNCRGMRGIRLDIPTSFDLRFSSIADRAEVRVAVPDALRRLRPGNSASQGDCTDDELAARDDQAQCLNVARFKSFAFRLDVVEEWVGHVVGCFTVKARPGCESYRGHPLMWY